MAESRSRKSSLTHARRCFFDQSCGLKHSDVSSEEEMKLEGREMTMVLQKKGRERSLKCLETRKARRRRGRKREGEKGERHDLEALLLVGRSPERCTKARILEGQPPGRWGLDILEEAEVEGRLTTGAKARKRSRGEEIHKAEVKAAWIYRGTRTVSQDHAEERERDGSPETRRVNERRVLFKQVSWKGEKGTRATLGVKQRLWTANVSIGFGRDH